MTLKRVFTGLVGRWMVWMRSYSSAPRGAADQDLPGDRLGLLGRAAFTGGLRTALLGVLCHFTFATSIVAVYVAASRELEDPRRQPIAAGMAYGVLAWPAMNYVGHSGPSAVTPGGPQARLRWAVNGLLIHMFGLVFPQGWRQDGRTG